MSQINPIHANIYHFMNIYFNIILTSMLRSSNGLFPSGFFFHQKPVRTSPHTHTCYIPRPFHSCWFDCPNDIQWGVETMTLIIISSCPPSRRSFAPKYLSQRYFVEYRQRTAFPQSKRPSFTPIQNVVYSYLITPCSRDLLEKLGRFQLVKELTAFYANRRFITAFTSARHLSLSWAS